MKSVTTRFVLVAFLAGVTSSFGDVYTSFKVLKARGDATIKPMGATEFVKVKPGTTYKFGAHMKTGRNSSALLQLSPDNTFRLLARTTAEITPAAKGGKLVKVKLASGNVNIQLDRFPKGNTFEIETPLGVCAVVGTRATIGFDTDEGRKNLSIDTEIGVVKWTSVDTDAWATVPAGGRIDFLAYSTGGYVYMRVRTSGPPQTVYLGGVARELTSGPGEVELKVPIVAGDLDWASFTVNVLAGTAEVAGVPVPAAPQTVDGSTGAMTPAPAYEVVELITARGQTQFGYPAVYVPPIVEDAPQSP